MLGDFSINIGINFDFHSLSEMAPDTRGADDRPPGLIRRPVHYKQASTGRVTGARVRINIQ